MTGQVVRLEGAALGYHLSEGKGWAEGYVVIINLVIICKVFETEQEAVAFASSIPVGWEPEGIHIWDGEITAND